MLGYDARCVTHLVLLGSEIMMFAGGEERREVCSSLWRLSQFPSCPFCTVNHIRCYEHAASKLWHALNCCCSWFLWSKSQTCDGNAVTICTNEVMIMSYSLVHSSCLLFALSSSHRSLKSQLSIFNHHTILVTSLASTQEISYCINHAWLGNFVSTLHTQLSVNIILAETSECS
jgi:hypothetical protein